MKRAPWTPKDTLAAAKQASRAGRRHLNRLASRGLDAAFFDLLDEDVERLQSLTAGQAPQLEQVRGKTRRLSEVVGEANRFVVSVRRAVVLTFPPRHPARATFGTSLKVRKDSLPDVLRALGALRQGMETLAADAAAAGLSASDLETVKGYLDELPRAESSQEDAKDLRKAATAVRNALHLSICERMNRLRIAAGLALVAEPAALAEIVSPYPRASRRKTKDAPSE